MVCTTFYNVITNAEFKQQYTGALDYIIEENKSEKTSGLSPSWYHCYQYITHRLKEKITTIDGDAGRIRHPRKKEKKITNKILFLTYCSGITEL